MKVSQMMKQKSLSKSIYFLIFVDLVLLVASVDKIKLRNLSPNKINGNSTEKNYKINPINFKENLTDYYEYFNHKKIKGNQFRNLDYTLPMNIITLSNENTVHIFHAKNENGDLFLETRYCPSDRKNSTSYYYALKQNGRYFFYEDNNNNFTPYKSLFIDKYIDKAYGDNIFIVNDNNNEIYLFSYDKNYFELYDYKSNTYSYIDSEDIFGRRVSIDSIKQGLFELKSSSSNSHCYLLASTKFDYDYDNGQYIYTYTLYLKTMKFNSININENNGYEIINYYDKDEQYPFSSQPFHHSNIISCFETNKKYIECQYCANNKYYLNIFDESLTMLNKITFDFQCGSPNNDPQYGFHKCLHLKDEIGIYITFIFKDDSQPKLQILQLNDVDFTLTNYLSFLNNNHIIINENNKYSFIELQSDVEYSYKDLIKISEEKFVLISFYIKGEGSLENYILIVLFNLFNEDKNLQINYYKFNFEEKNNIKIHTFPYISGFEYNKNFGFSFRYFNNTSKNYYSGFLILNYCNSTDYYIENIFTNYTFTPKEHIKIENNIFNYYLSAISIVTIPDNSITGIKILSNINDNIISTGEEINSEDKLIIVFPRTTEEKEYYMEFVGIAIEPEYELYQSLFDDIKFYGGESQEKFFVPQKYIGRLAQFNFTIVICGIGCLECDIKNKSKCEKCENENNYYFIEGTEICTNSTPKGYYLNLIDKNYQKCHKDCLSCFDSPNDTSSNCIDCIDNNKKPDYGNCISINETSNLCEDIGCKLCLYFNHFNCIDCDYENNFYFIEDNEGKNKECTNSKPDNYYFDSNKKMFKKCHSDCNSCNEGPNEESTNCITCKDIDAKINLGNCLSKPCSDEKCLTCNKESLLGNQCTKCNNNLGYYSINRGKEEVYVDCYNIKDKPIGYYLNLNTKFYEKCHKRCGNCDYIGNEKINNCTSCLLGDILLPDKSEETNCYFKCKTYYYFDYNIYKCTSLAQCPRNTPLIVRQKKKCIDKCINDDTYKYEYNAECIKICPEDTHIDNNKCIDKDINKCTLTKYELDFSVNEFEENNYEIIVDNYAQEFNYTTNHISLYKNIYYTVLLFKNYLCLNEFGLNKIDLGECPEKIKKYYGLNEIIISLVDIYQTNKNQNPTFLYNFHNPYTGQKLSIGSICADEKLIKIISVESLPTININIITELTSQNINIFNLSHAFYNDICYHFESNKSKDVPLNDRIKTYYPNITLCEINCINTGVNLTTLEAICVCKFKKKLFDDLFDNELIGTDEAIELITESNIEVLKCYKDLFVLKYFKKNIGGLNMIALIILQTICVIYFVKKRFKLIDSYLDAVKVKYNNYKSGKKRNKNKDKNEKYIKAKKNMKDDSNNIFKLDEPPKKLKTTIINKTININYNNNNNNNNINDLLENIQNNNINERNGDKSKTINNNKSKIKREKNNKQKSENTEIKKNQKKRKNKANKEKEANKSKILFEVRNLKIKNHNTNKFSSLNSKNLMIYKQHDNVMKQSEIKNNKIQNNKNEEMNNNFNIDLKEILFNNTEEFDFQAYIEKEKRSFCELYKDKLIDSQQILNLITISNYLVPKEINLLLLLINIDIFFVINGLLYNEKYISELFYSEEKEKFFSFVERSISRIIYVSLIGVAIDTLILIFFPDKNKIKRILIKFQNKHNEMNKNIKKFSNSVKNRYKVFIIISYIITLFSWYYITCFNNVYPYTKFEWFKSSLLLIIIIQILTVITSFIFVILRYISIKSESQYIFYLSDKFA